MSRLPGRTAHPLLGWCASAALLLCSYARTHAQAPPEEPAAPTADPAAQAEPEPREQTQPTDAQQTPLLDAQQTSADDVLDPATEAQLAALLAQPAGEEQIASDGPSLSLYGFGDMLVMKSYPNRRLGAFPPESVIMTIGNINLYAAADLTHGISSLLEVRFTFLPNGGIDPSTFAPVSTTVLDYADWNRPVQWGGVVTERFHLDYSYSSLLNIRLGLFLTPYGIWNVDHGSPTVIPVMKPYVVGEQLFPTRQTGFQLSGSTLLGDATVGYTLTLSNGRGDIQHLDLDKNKALGGRLFLSYSGLGNLTLGFSAYTGIATRSPRYAVMPGNPPTISSESDDSFRELALAGDLLWEWRDFRLQAEVVSGQNTYRDKSRKLASGFGTRSGFIPDHTAWGAYVLLAYRLPWLSIMPFVVGENFDRGYARGQLLVLGGNTVNVVAFRAGVNVRPVPQLALKAQYSYIKFPGDTLNFKIPNLSFQAAWAF